MDSHLTCTINGADHAIDVSGDESFVFLRISGILDPLIWMCQDVVPTMTIDSEQKMARNRLP